MQKYYVVTNAELNQEILEALHKQALFIESLKDLAIDYGFDGAFFGKPVREFGVGSEQFLGFILSAEKRHKHEGNLINALNEFVKFPESWVAKKGLSPMFYPDATLLMPKKTDKALINDMKHRLGCNDANSIFEPNQILPILRRIYPHFESTPTTFEGVSECIKFNGNIYLTITNNAEQDWANINGDSVTPSDRTLDDVNLDVVQEVKKEAYLFAKNKRLVINCARPQNELYNIFEVLQKLGAEQVADLITDEFIKISKK